MSVTAFIKNRWRLSNQKPRMELYKCNLNSIDLWQSDVHKLYKRSFINTYILNCLAIISSVSEGMKILSRTSRCLLVGFLRTLYSLLPGKDHVCYMF